MATPKGAITVRIDTAKRKELDALAEARKKDRSSLVNEAVEQYLAHEAWQIEQIEEGLRQADAGDFATPQEVERAFARFGA
ncbi:ribbon-helix-helix protein, CopG family [Patescibacteria group bacterium]|jgi:predicted transcriptional regulator|nr:ribbon-helix-helix protein, CopG family [Patescibacteria group bacterium]